MIFFPFPVTPPPHNHSYFSWIKWKWNVSPPRIYKNIIYIFSLCSFFLLSTWRLGLVCILVSFVVYLWSHVFIRNTFSYFAFRFLLSVTIHRHHVVFQFHFGCCVWRWNVGPHRVKVVCFVVLTHSFIYSLVIQLCRTELNCWCHAIARCL